MISPLPSLSRKATIVPVRVHDLLLPISIVKKIRVGAVTILWKKGFNGAAIFVYDGNCARHSTKLGEGWLVCEKRCDEFLVLTTLGRFGGGMG